jgi:phosphatidylserine/phosphatidylglycerophosphate/cardiolipin synthase-like enzyme
MNIQLAFSPGPDCRKMILSEISNSDETLDICVFTISDNQIKDAIISAHHRGIQVRVISDNFNMVVDSKRILTGSYNWTRTAELQNAENIIVLNDISISGKFLVEFEKLWESADVV